MISMRQILLELIGSFSFYYNTLLNKSQVMHFILEVVVTDRFHCVLTFIVTMVTKSDLNISSEFQCHDAVIKWKHSPRYWPFVRGSHQSLLNSPSQRPVLRIFDVFFDLRLNKRLNKQSTRRWFETPLFSLWRHCNVMYDTQQQHHHGTNYIYIPCITPFFHALFGFHSAVSIKVNFRLKSQCQIHPVVPFTNMV